MKNTLLGLFLCLIPTLMMAQAPAQVQIIHNCADMAANPVDVYVNGVLTLDDVAFRTATAYLPIPSGVAVQVDIAPGNSTSVANSIYNATYTLNAAQSYVIVADGIVSATGYNPGNTGATAFELYVYAMGQATAGTATNTDVLVHHGATDAPAVDVVEVSGMMPNTIVANASYSDFSNYIALPTADYRLEVRPAGMMTAVGSYEAPLATLGLAGQAIVVVASGFLDPSVNSNGPGFGLWAALPTGGALVELPPSTARVQVIHNSADAAAAQVDVYLDDALLLDNFAFRTATAYVDVPAGVGIEIAVAGSNSTSSANAVGVFNYTLAANETYVIVADGIVSGSGYMPGNTGASAFDLKVYDMGQEAATMMSNTDVLVHHGSTDAPAVDVVEVGVGAGPIVQNASYGDFSGYLNLATADYRLEVRPAGSSAVVASYEAPLATLNLGGGAVVAVASGFLDPSMNSGGPAFGVYVALPAGGPLLALPKSTARAQVIHNCADAAATQVDVYIDGALAIDDFTFRTATAFIDLNAGVETEVAIAPSTSTSVADSIKRFVYSLNADNTYIIVADGIVSTTGYSPAQPFTLSVYDMGQEAAANATEIDLLVHHGSTDAPTVDVRSGGAVLVDDASYGDFAGYLNLADQDYIIDITNATGSATVASYQAPLNTLGLAGTANTVLASGFLDPTMNSNGPSFGLWVATAAGGNLLELSTVVSVDRVNGIEGIEMTLAPNPVVTDLVRLQITADQAATALIEVVDAQGKTMISRTNLPVQAGTSQQELNVEALANGTYWVRMSTDGQQLTIPFVVNK